MDSDKLNNYLFKIAEEIFVSSEKINDLIPHVQTKGSYREFLLRGILKRYLPKKYDVATGFILGCSRQCDIIIYDANNFAPIFKEEDLIVVHPKAVRAVIEVKTNLNSKSLNEGLALIDDVSQFLLYSKPAFKAIFSFTSSYKNVNAPIKNIKKFYNDDPDKSKYRSSFQVIDCICTPNQFSLYSSLRDPDFIEKKSIEPRIYVMTSKQKVNLGISLFLFQLFKFLDIDKQSKKMNYEVFKDIIFKAKFSEGYPLYESYKQNFFLKGLNNRHEFNIEQYLSDIAYWQFGDLSSADFENKYME